MLPIPPIASEMKRVSGKEFFAALYKSNADIMPSIISNYHKNTGYLTVWQTNNSIHPQIFGVSDCGTTFHETRYWVK